MSGGCFDHTQSYISHIADDIETMICNNGSEEKDEYGDYIYHQWEPEIIEQFKIAVQKLREAYIYAQRIDWLVSGDDGYDKFLSRLEEELTQLKTATQG